MAIMRSMVIPDAYRTLANSIADMFAGSPQNMWNFPLSATGQAPVTHWIAAGPVPNAYEQMAPWQTWQWQVDDQGQGAWVMTDAYPGDPVTVYEACQAADPPVQCTEAEVEDLFNVADVTDQGPWTAMSRLGLQPVYSEEPPPPAPEGNDG